MTDINKPKSQVETTQMILEFLGDYKINNAADLPPLIKRIKDFLEIREYNELTKIHADSIQWKRTATQILEDGYVYKGKSCSDLVLVLIALCKALALEAQLVKLVNLPNTSSHSIAEIKINGEWYRVDPSMNEPKVVKGSLESEDVWNKDSSGGWKVWKKGVDLWSMGLSGIDSEKSISEE